MCQPASATDSRGDGIIDGIGNCPTIAHSIQHNFDADNGEDLCDDDDDHDGLPGFAETNTGNFVEHRDGPCLRVLTAMA